MVDDLKKIATDFKESKILQSNPSLEIKNMILLPPLSNNSTFWNYIKEEKSMNLYLFTKPSLKIALQISIKNIQITNLRQIPTQDNLHLENSPFHPTIPQNSKNLLYTVQSAHGTAYPPLFQQKPSKAIKPNTKITWLIKHIIPNKSIQILNSFTIRMLPYSSSTVAFWHPSIHPLILRSYNTISIPIRLWPYESYFGRWHELDD